MRLAQQQLETHLRSAATLAIDLCDLCKER